MFPQSGSTMLSSNRKTYPAPFVIPPEHWRSRRGGKEKINAVKCGDRKMSFWQMQGFVYAQIEFWWISPQARPLFLFIGLHIKMLNNDVTESKYKCHWHKASPNEPMFLCGKYCLLKRDSHLKPFFWKLIGLFMVKCYRKMRFRYSLSWVVCMGKSVQIHLH